MHPHDHQNRLVSKHPGSKRHKGGVSLRQRHRNAVASVKAVRLARVATVKANSKGEN